jgi:pilus assembly protein Flp/PilA
LKVCSVIAAEKPWRAKAFLFHESRPAGWICKRHAGRKMEFYKKRRCLAMLFAPKENGQGLVEYALILVLVAVVVIVILALLGPAIGKIFSNVVNMI